MNRSPILFAAIPLLLATLAVLGWQWNRSTSPLPMRDFVEYYTASEAFLNHRDPYDPYLLLDMQRRILDDPSVDQPVMMWNPPWAFAIVAPLALVSPNIAHMLWLLAQLLAVIASVAMLLHVYDVPVKLWIAGFLAAMVFSPFHLLMWYGQIGGFILLGLAGFLFFQKRGQHLTAGAFAALTALKPHLLFAFGLMLLCDALVNSKSRRAVLGGLCAVVAAALAVWLVNPMVYGHYFDSISKPSSDIHFSVRDWAQPLLSYELRIALDRTKFSYQFIPTFAAAAIVFTCWLIPRKPIDWPRTQPGLILISVICCAYGAWMFDLVVLLVPVIHALSMLLTSKHWIWYAAAYTLLNLASTFSPIIAVNLTGTGVGLPLFIYFSPAIAVLYCLAKCFPSRSAV